ncbi:MAG: AAA family ATPase [Oscillospiraceae bacterium]|nr:AAA family ATPase [Oscillospiraceae bacterium]
MFRNLFNERGGVDVITRIEQFKESSVELLKKYGGEARNHYQDENVISTYLWLRYPDKYYIYKYGIASKVSKVLDSDYQIETISKNDYTSAEKTLRNFYSLYDEICDCVSADDELTSLLKEHLSDDCWSDPSYRTLTMDVCFHISWCYINGETARDKYEFIFPINYSPKLTVSDWTELLRNPDVFTEKGLQVVTRIKDYGGQATCLQLSKKYGEDKNFYISNTTSVAKRICETKHIKPDTRSDGTPYYWSVLYVGRNANDNEDGSFVWKLRDELAEALDNMDLNGIELYSSAENAEPCAEKVQYKNRYSPVLVSSKNIIFHGAPGTGKTYLAKEIAADIVSSGETSDYSKLSSEQRLRIEFVQFHPSYDYSDFVEGLRPVLNSDGSMGFELRNGIFKSFVTRARKNYEDSLERGEEPEKFVFIIDEINRGEISKILGELFFAIDPNYRGTAGEVSTQYSNLHENPDEKFYVPENVYIIGTMNDIDRSVDSFDFAMRRRFRFIELGADENIDMLDSLGELKPEAVRRMKSLNAAIAEVEDLNRNYQIGVAYFLKLKEMSLDELWTDNLKPLLQDYVQGIYGEEDIMKTFEKAYNCQNGDTDEESEN